MNKFTIILPFKLPTWNQLLAMDHWQRKQVRTWLHNFVCASIPEGADWETLTGEVSRPFLTDLQKQEYGLMIQPNSSKKFALRKSWETRIKRLSR